MSDKSWEPGMFWKLENLKSWKLENFENIKIDPWETTVGPFSYGARVNFWKSIQNPPKRPRGKKIEKIF